MLLRPTARCQPKWPEVKLNGAFIVAFLLANVEMANKALKKNTGQQRMTRLGIQIFLFF